MAARYVAFLRGINVGGKHILPMKDLKTIFENASCTDVLTYIQSGNVVFRTNAKNLKTLAARVAAQIHAQFGFSTPMVIRNAVQIQAILDGNPFLQTGADLAMLHVVFLADLPSSCETLDPQRSPPDEFRVVGQEIYLHTPNGAGNTKLTNAYFDSKLKTVSTGRNWRTVNTILAMMID